MVGGQVIGWLAGIYVLGARGLQIRSFRRAGWRAVRILALGRYLYLAWAQIKIQTLRSVLGHCRITMVRGGEAIYGGKQPKKDRMR